MSAKKAQPSTVVFSLDRKVEEEVNEAARVFLSGVAKAAEEAEEADDDEALDPPTLEISEMHSWLMQSCAPNPSINTALAHYICSVIAMKLVDLEQRQIELDARADWLLHSANYKIAENTLYVNYPLVMEYMASSNLTVGEMAIVPIPYGAPDNADDGLQDLLFFVTPWEGHYLCRPIKCSLAEVSPLLDSISGGLPKHPRPTVNYQQGRFFH